MADDEPRLRKCCPTAQDQEHQDGCRYSKNRADGTPKPPTPAQQRRARQANDAADEQAATGFDSPTDERDDMPDEREEWFRAPGLQRMQMDFDRDTKAVMQRIESNIEQRVFKIFVDAYQIMSDVYDVVREAEEDVDPATGELRSDGPLLDATGNVVWKRNPVSGKYYEDWTRLGLKQRENLLFEITTKMFDWEQRRERLWTEAMFGKAIFTERFAEAFDGPMSGTVDDRNAVGNIKAAEDRYFALMVTSVSRRADAVCRTMDRIATRIRDVMQS